MITWKSFSLDKSNIIEKLYLYGREGVHDLEYREIVDSRISVRVQWEG